MDPMAFLTAWYEAQCDGHWELTHGVTMESLDTPGWLVTIDLEGTPLEDRAMLKIEMEVSREDWLVCEVNRKQFRGLGDPGKLPAIARIFQVLAETAD
jgi:hypothetical protein